MYEIGGHHLPADHIRSAPGGVVAKESVQTFAMLPPAAPIAEIGQGVTPAADGGGASGGLYTSKTMPLPQLIGHSDVSGDDAAKRPVETRGVLPHVANIGGHARLENHIRPAPKGEAPSPALTAYINELCNLQRVRRFCIVSQSRCDRSCEAFIARYIGMPLGVGDDEKAIAKARKEMFKQAQTLRKSVERRDGKGHSAGENQTTHALPVVTSIILANMLARKAWDDHRSDAERGMRKIARSLPVWTWSRDIKGFGELGLAIIIGETGDLSKYATKERVWKRLGLAVIDGERQGRRSNAEQAAAHGFNPKRRAEIWTIADSMFKHQWHGAKDDAPSGPSGPYGEVYARRKAFTVTREWTAAHRDNDARRVMTKAFVEHLWLAWRRI